MNFALFANAQVAKAFMFALTTERQVTMASVATYTGVTAAEAQGLLDILTEEGYLRAEEKGIYVPLYRLVKTDTQTRLLTLHEVRNWLSGRIHDEEVISAFMDWAEMRYSLVKQPRKKRELTEEALIRTIGMLRRYQYNQDRDVLIGCLRRSTENEWLRICPIPRNEWQVWVKTTPYFEAGRRG